MPVPLPRSEPGLTGSTHGRPWPADDCRETGTCSSMSGMITSDAITWTAPNDDHPARAASQRSYSAVAKGDLAEWLTVYAEDAVLEDPVGPSMFDPEGKGHHGHEGIAAFWKLAIEPIEKFEFTITE